MRADLGILQLVLGSLAVLWCGSLPSERFGGVGPACSVMLLACWITYTGYLRAK